MYDFELVTSAMTNTKQLKVSFQAPPKIIAGLEYPPRTTDFQFSEEQIRTGDFPGIGFESDADQDAFTRKAGDFFFETVAPQFGKHF